MIARAGFFQSDALPGAAKPQRQIFGSMPGLLPTAEKADWVVVISLLTRVVTRQS